MATAISTANFEAACGEVYDAISSGSYANAWKYYAMAEAQLAALAVQLGDEGGNLRRRESLDGLRKAITAAETAAGKHSGNSRVGRLQTGFGRGR